MANLLAAGLVPPVRATDDKAPEPIPNRATRRAMDRKKRHFERQRRKFDKFVQPQGPTPVKITRAKKEPLQPAAPEPQDKPAPGTFIDNGDEFLFVDVHHADRKTKVLYEPAELSGEFNFRDTILDQLDRYFVYLDRMKKRDVDAYEFYKQVGATLIPYVATPDVWLGHEPDADEYRQPAKISPWFNATRPAFGCIAYGTNPEAERIELEERDKKESDKVIWIPKFLYFTKYVQPPPEWQPMSGGDIYKMTIWWDRPQDRKMEKKLKGGGTPETYGIFVSADGNKVVALRQLQTRLLEIYSKRHGVAEIPQRLWRLPNEYEQWAKHRNTDAQRLLTNIFVDSATRIETSAWSLVRVTVSKNGRRATFGVDVRRTPYFFQDRDIELTGRGQKKRIFHMVRPHERNGKAVGFTFRGQRQFTWAGYDVLITVPGRDHLMLEEIPVGAVDEYWMESKKKYLNGKQFGGRLASYIAEGVGGIHP